MRNTVLIVCLIVAPTAFAGEASYRLPFEAGTSRPCTQSNNGSTSHKGRSKHAFDFSMAESTTVCAARGGRVVKAVDDEPKNGREGKYGASGNHVKIDHGDGTTGIYMHLSPDGALVEVGDEVMQGDAIARSGNTGWSTGPHLHFVVYDESGQSIPIQFADVQTDDGVPASGKTYTSNNVPGIPAATKDALRALERAAKVALEEGAPVIEREAWERYTKIKLEVSYPPQERARLRLLELDGVAASRAEALRAKSKAAFAEAARELLRARVSCRRLPGAKALSELEAELEVDERFKEIKRELRSELKAFERYLKGLREELLGKPKTARKQYGYVVRRAPDTEIGRRAGARLQVLEARLKELPGR